ncbi:uncharacterized protein LOC131664762 isoform X2 [Phymastichus coffea]|uniref:uncharacterized protein LOC131664762 isoform X2 n=1 Tax=Phymastichus coffea TaxID=108790 RepID=UPI00273B5789|nr:uncharacterized protein LOC131664762 isoform X2 [Phymastichus coffea]
MSIVERLRKHKRFCASVGSVNLGALCVGLAMAWPKPSLAYAHEAAHPQLPFVDEAWVESIINAGASLGSLASIFISGFYGRRTSFCLSGAILAAFWLFLGFSGGDKVLIISAAAVAGLGVGTFSATAVLYVAEISTLKSRGVVGTSVMLSGCLGIFAINLLGRFFDTGIAIGLMAAPPLCFLASVRLLVIESPFYLFQKGAVLQAKTSLTHLRARHSLLEVDEEFRSMEAMFNRSFSKGTGRRRLLESLCPGSTRPLGLAAVPVLCVSQMLGLVALTDYAEQLVESICPYSRGLLTSFVDVASSVLCVFAIERFGRRALLFFTVVGCGLCCLALALYHLTRGEQCYAQELLAADHRTLPTVVLCVYYGIYALGLTPVLPIVTAEIFPCRAKAAAVGICTSLLYFVAFCTRRSYEALNQYTSSCFAFACFAMLGSIALPFVVAALPETAPTSLLQMQTELDNGVVINY